ncbi:MAG: CehA/McbA family metallohydrolase [Sedimentisphaerales bacterium]|nr:CehA/McbA family metallohydrolase [Sedimentisphaerales bacterium]
MKLVNPFETEGKWFKANLHCHSLASDGDRTTADRVVQYRERGYDVLALTDHRITHDITAFADDGILVISGMEDHPDCYFGGDMYHFVCLNVPFGFERDLPADANDRISAVRQAGGEVILAHPYWCGHNVNHVMAVSGYIGLEVYNACCTPIGKGYSSVVWDDVLAEGRVVPAVAVDDTHYSDRDMCKGWTMIKAKELTIEAIMGALRCGCYYATNGPEIKTLTIADGKAKVTCSPVKEIHFMSRRSIGLSIYAEAGQTLENAEIDIRPDACYVRVELVDETGLRAWSNPFIVDADKQ